MRNPMTSGLLRFAQRLRFPQLFMVTAGLFVLDLLIPDLVPFADELLLGLLTVLFASWRKRRREGDGRGRDADMIDVTPTTH